MTIEINITPMSLKNGVMGLPINACRDWDATESKAAKFIYADRKTDITFSPKHIDYNTGLASAWQFTVNDSVQFASLKIDGVYTYAEDKMSGEKLVCDLYEENGELCLEVKDVNKHEPTNACKKICELLQQGIRPVSELKGKAPLWNSPSAWTDFSEIDSYKEVTDCVYIWYGLADNDPNTYIYVGIVGDTAAAGKSKRNLCQRLKEEQKAALKKYGIDINIRKFRFCSLNDARGMAVPELLKTIEMSEITVLSSLFNCSNARDNIDALFSNSNIVLLNSSTSYKYVK